MRAAFVLTITSQVITPFGRNPRALTRLHPCNGLNPSCNHLIAHHIMRFSSPLK